MSSDKQLIANQQNAQLSKGPITEEGKMVVAANAIKHGIFTRDLIISSALFSECREEYEEMLNNLIACLAPQNQMESLLVEKIAADFWRLRRVMRFEMGSISKLMEKLFNDFYSYSRTNNRGIDKEIAHKRWLIEWNLAYIGCLQKGEVTFDQPLWKGAVESDILDDFYLIAKNIKELPRDQRDGLYSGTLEFSKIREILNKHGFSSERKISERLIELFTQQNQSLEKEITELEKQKLDNDVADEHIRTLAILPDEGSADKIMKYERSLQKSIFQNLFFLKQLPRSA